MIAWALNSFQYQLVETASGKRLGLANRRLVTTSADGTVRQWNPRTGQQVKPPYKRHTGEVVAAAYSPERATIRVQAVYVRFLGRPSDAEGLAFWTGAFKHGSTNEDIITGFLGSDEYFRQATS